MFFFVIPDFFSTNSKSKPTFEVPKIRKTLFAHKWEYKQKKWYSVSLNIQEYRDIKYYHNVFPTLVPWSPKCSELQLP